MMRLIFRCGTCVGLCFNCPWSCIYMYMYIYFPLSHYPISPSPPSPSHPLNLSPSPHLSYSPSIPPSHSLSTVHLSPDSTMRAAVLLATPKKKRMTKNRRQRPRKTNTPTSVRPVRTEENCCVVISVPLPTTSCVSFPRSNGSRTETGDALGAR